ncbi:MAG: GntR family transcriptional regulator [Ardenticatenaceae bacterium]|nr:GntR family transcriptional regulator [Ardenticatenaceae bacterium]
MDQPVSWCLSRLHGTVEDERTKFAGARLPGAEMGNRSKAIPLSAIRGATPTFRIERADPLVEVVFQQLTDAIVTGQLPPGSQLVETQVGEQLGVSRGPVREAIHRLEQMGLVEKIPYRGAFVSRLTRTDIEELNSIRRLMEGLAARILAERHDPNAVVALEKVLETMHQAATNHERGRIVRLDAEFHGLLISLTEHKLLNEIWKTISVQFLRFLLLKRQRLYHTLEQVVPLHEPIIRAISDGDGDQAELEARRHVLWASQALLEGNDIQPDEAERGHESDRPSQKEPT